ncbi:MAG: fibronectin-binding domain-containing protein, partial [Christensenellaceae bacterium]|nr:fibronectin-binding domain-containing protein [Christensenellaceae bacterium]
YQNPPSQNKLSPLNFTRESLNDIYDKSMGKLDNIIFNNILGLSKQSATEIAFRIAKKYDAFKDDINSDIFADKLIDFFKNLHELYKPNIVFDADKNPVDFFPFEYSQYIDSNLLYTNSISAAMDIFYSKRDLRNRISQQSASLRKLISNLIARTENKLNQIENILASTKQAEEFKLYGELLTSSFHELKNVPKGSETVYLTNYYLEGMPKVAIPLNPTMSFSENAQNYFKKYRKHRTAVELAGDQKKDILRDLMFLEGNMLDLDNCTTVAEIAEIKQALIDAKFIKKDKLKNKGKNNSLSKPLHFVSPDGIDIFVGKNSTQNDMLTSKAKPDETWLHVQNMPGSHVIIKSEQTIPDATLLFAAKIAAFFSKGRTSPRVDIDYTLKKHVKKPSGSPLGFVTYKNFKTILVALDDEDLSFFKSKI